MKLLATLCLLALGHAVAMGQLEANDDLSLRAGPNVTTTLNIGANDVFPRDATFEIVRQANGGVVQDFANGWVSYVPRPGFTGLDSFTYRIRRGDTTSRVAVAKVRVRLGVVGVNVFYENFPDHDINIGVGLMGTADEPKLLELWSDVPSIKAPRYSWVQPGQDEWTTTYRVAAPNTVQRGQLYYRFNGETGSIPIVHEPFYLNFRIVPDRNGALGFIDPNAGLGSTPYTITASTPLVEVPAQIDGTSQVFRIKVKEARWSFPVTIEIRRGTQYWKSSFNTVPAFLLPQLDSERVTGGQTVNLKVGFAGTVGSPGTLELRSNSVWATVPATVKLPSNRSEVIVPIQTLGTRIERTITIWARIRGVERKVTLTVVP